MRFFPFILLVVILISALGFFLTMPSSSVDRTAVSATIFPIFDITREIAGDKMTVNLLVPPGASPHTYEATPQTVKNIQRSKVIFAIGSLDDWITELSDQTPVVRVHEEIEYLTYNPTESHAHATEHEDEASHDDEVADKIPQDEMLDPHYWLDVSNAIIIARQITTQLTEIDPENAEYYQENFNQYQSELEALDAELAESIGTLPNKNIATFHNSWQYFANAYGLHIVTTFEEFPGQTPGPQYLAAFAQTLANGQVDAVYSEPQLPIDKLEPIANEYNVPLGTLDPLGGSEGRSSYIEVMRYNKAQLEATLQ